MKDSCIYHPPEGRLVIRRESYMILCKGNQCVAELLAVMEYWTNWKKANNAQKREEARQRGRDISTMNFDTWIYKTAQTFADEDLLSAYSERTVRNALNYLIEHGFIQRRRNPRYGWDRTYQYKLNISAVQTAINEIITSHENSNNGKFTAHGRKIYRL